MNSQTNRDENGSGKRVFSMRFVLASTFGALVALSVGIVLFMSVDSNLNNTFSLLNERAESLITGMEDEIRQETGRTELSVQTFASLYANGTIENLEQAEVEPVFRTILTTEPAVEALFLYRTDGTLLYLRRDPEDKIESFSPNWFSSEAKASLVDQLTGNFDEPKWGQPVKIGPVLFNFVFLPLVRDGQNNGYIVAAVGRYVVNRIIARIGRSNFTTAFVLDANNNVIAYSADPELLRGRSDYPLAEFPDKTLADYLNAESTDRFRKALRSGILVKETEGRQGYVYITKTLAGASGNPYTLGAYFKKSDIGAEVFRAIRTFFVGILGLLVAVLVAFLLGRRISLPMVAIAKTARQLSAFDIDGLKPLPGSRIREINDQAEALNNVRRAMREFARYVPRPLVARLIRSGVDRIPTVEREITIMFSDIVGFTSLSEHMNAADTARILNDFFEMQCQEIEASKGTVDKFMGDGLMAFWGAPDADTEHPAHAVTTAIKITNAVRAFNEERRKTGSPSLRIRIGIHTGRVVVGNIGGGSRQNYTIVGDAVNLAQRLEQMGREFMDPDDDAIVLLSGETVKDTGDRFQVEPAGTRILRGREKPVKVYILDTGATVKSEKVVAFPGSGKVS